MKKSSQYPEKYLEGLRLYAEGKFWESHESWEELWRAAEGVERHFYQGLIQLDAALLHIRRNHWKGVKNLLTRSLGHFQHCPAHFLGLDVKRLKLELDLLLKEVHQLLERKKPEFNWSIQPKLVMKEIGNFPE